MSLQTINGHASAGRPYVPGIIARGDLIFVSGQIPMRDGRIVDESIEAQVEVVLENIESILRHAGASLSDVVRCGVLRRRSQRPPAGECCVRTRLRRAPAHAHDRRCAAARLRRRDRLHRRHPKFCERSTRLTPKATTHALDISLHQSRGPCRWSVPRRINWICVGVDQCKRSPCKPPTVAAWRIAL